MKTQKISLFNVDFPGFFATDADLRDGRIGHVNYALSQVDIASGVDTELNARGRVAFSLVTGFSPNGLGAGSTLEIGTKYLIDYLEEGDDFTNVGAAENAVGVVFTATGETPAVWNGSKLIQNGAQQIVDNMVKYGAEKNFKWILVYGDSEYNKGFDVIGGPTVIEESAVIFDLTVVDKNEVLDNLEYFYGNMTIASADFKVYDSTFPNLQFGIFVDTDAEQFYLTLSDASADFRNYTVWSSPITTAYRSLNTGELKYPIGSTSRATAVTDALYLSEFVDQEDGKIYIPVFEPKLGLRFDFEIRLYDYVAPAPVVDIDVQALQEELARLEVLLKEADSEGNTVLAAQLKEQIDVIRKLLASLEV